MVKLCKVSQIRENSPWFTLFAIHFYSNLYHSVVPESDFRIYNLASLFTPREAISSLLLDQWAYLTGNDSFYYLILFLPRLIYILWSSSQFYANVANYSICPILIGLLRLTVANESECCICQFSLQSDSTLMNLTVAKIGHIWATRYGVFLKDAIF